MTESLALLLQAQNLSAAARDAAISQAGDNAQSLVDAALQVISGATSYDPAEAITQAQIDAASPGGIKRIYQGGLWKLLKPTLGNMPPMGIGDGSPADHAAMVTSRVFGMARYHNVTGGQGGVIRQVTTLADDAAGTTTGSLRYHLLAHLAANKTDRTSASIITFDPALQVGTTRAKINLAAKLPILGRNLTVEASALPLGLELNPGGRPGPIPYGVTTGTVAAVTSAANFTVTLTSGSQNFTGARIEVSELVDLHTEDTNGNVTATHSTAATVVSWDATAHTVTLNGTAPTGVPAGATLIMTGDSSGKVGFGVQVGVDKYNDAFPSPGDGAISGNLIFRNIFYNGNWGGDVVDVGNQKDWVTNWWTTGVLYDHMSWTNPSPFHDVMLNVGSGSRGVTYRDCHLFNDYKAANTINAVGAASPGTDPTTGITAAIHNFPPDTLVNPPRSSYDLIVNPGTGHGNTTGADITVSTVTYYGCWFDTLGQRGPEMALFAQVHLLNCLHENFGLHNDPLKQVPTVFPQPGVAATGGPAVEIISGASARIEGCSFIPKTGSSGGALIAAKNSPSGKNSAGNLKTLHNYYAPGTTVLADTANGDPSKVYDAGSLYPYPVPQTTPTAADRALIRANAGAGTTSSMWQYVGTPTASAAVTVTDHGVALGSGGATASAVAIDVQGPLLKGTFASGVLTLTGKLLTPTAVKTGAYTAVAGELVPVSTTGGAVTITLPTTPADGTAVAVKMTAQASSNIATVQCGGADVFITTGASSTTQRKLKTLGQTILAQYSTTLTGWVVVADSFALDQLDARLTPVQSFSVFWSGALTVAAGKGKWYAPEAGSWTDMRAFANTAPTGAAVIFDVQKNGTSIFTTTGNRPTIAASATSGAEGALPDTVSFAAGDVFTFSVTQIGSTVAGSDAQLQLMYKRTISP